MNFIYLGKYSLGDVRVSAFFAPRDAIVVSVLSCGATALVQAFTRLALTGVHLKKGVDVSTLLALASAHGATLEIGTAKAVRELVERLEPALARKTPWLAYALSRVERDLDREKEDYAKWKGVRDLEEAEDNLRARREEIFDLNQKLVHNAQRPELIYATGKWRTSAYQETDRIRFRELKDQAKERASAVRQRIDFTRRQRIRELEQKRKDLLEELDAERKAEGNVETRVTALVNDGTAASLQVNVRSAPLFVQGRRGPAVQAAARDARARALALQRDVRERIGLACARAEVGAILTAAMVSDIGSLSDARVPGAAELTRLVAPAFGLVDAATLEKDLRKTLASLLGRLSPPPAPPDLMRFPSMSNVSSKRLAFLGFALDSSVRPTSAPVFYDLDEQGPRHTAVVGGSGSGKSVAASLIVEGAALHGIPVTIFDPTRSWTGFALPCVSESLLKKFSDFQLNREWAHGFDVRIVELGRASLAPLPARDVLDAGGLTVLTPTDLTEDQEARIVAGLLKRLYDEIKSWPESKTLRRILVFEEAHRYLKHKDVEPILELFARTTRARGVGLLVVSQVAVDLPPSVRSNCATKIQMHTAYAQDLTRVGQTFGSDFQKLVPRLMQGQGVMHYPEYGSALVAFRPPLHSPTALPEGVARLYTANRDLGRVLAGLMRQNTPPGPAVAAETQKLPEANKGPRPTQTTEDWRSVATRVASGPERMPKARDVRNVIMESGHRPPSLRTLQRFLKALT